MSKKSITVLRELVDRIAEHCASTGREDLRQGLFVLESLARMNSKGMTEKRELFLELIGADKRAVGATQMISDIHRELSQAEVEKLSATIQ